MSPVNTSRVSGHTDPSQYFQTRKGPALGPVYLYLWTDPAEVAQASPGAVLRPPINPKLTPTP